ncbi:MAG: ABC transporter permease [Bdellovibrionales bacterium]
MTSFRLALLSLTRRRVPTLITVCAIAISVACSGILLRLYHLSSSRFDSIGQGWEAVVGAKAGGIEILLNSLNGEGPYPDYLPYVLFESLQAAKAVHFEDGHTSDPNYIRAISPFLYFAKFQSYRVAGTDQAFAAALGGFTEGGWPSANDEVVLGAGVAKRAGIHLGDTIQLQPWLADHLGDANVGAKVAGILKPTGFAWDRMLFSSVAFGQSVISANRAYLGDKSIWGEKVLNYFMINLQPGGFRPLEALVNKRTVGQVVRVEEERHKLEELTGAGKSIGLFVSVFVILLSSLSVSSMLITRFEAMGVQLAVLRAIGYVRSEIGMWLIWEGLLLGLAGCVLGAVIDGVSFPILRDLLGSALPPADIVASSLSESYPVWVVTIPATVFAIFVPLIRLYRQDVHQALKG